MDAAQLKPQLVLLPRSRIVSFEIVTMPISKRIVVIHCRPAAQRSSQPDIT
jgi:hypothetical protein